MEKICFRHTHKHNLQLQDVPCGYHSQTAQPWQTIREKNATNYDLRLWEVLVDYHLGKHNYQTKHSYATQHSGKSAKYMTILTGFL